ncbi:aldehyde dehydrogenase family protein [bacterium]|nr:aldehyde dehydrogenase family protein [bacterium]
MGANAKQTTGSNPTALIDAELAKINSPIKLKAQYDNFIGGDWVKPAGGQYFDNLSPITGHHYTKAARSDAKDIERALDAAHKAKDAWGKTSPAERSRILNAIADRMEQHIDTLALVETWDNGKPLRESRFGDLPLSIDHFRYFASCVRTQEGSISEIDHETVAYHYHEPLGVVGQIIPWNFPLLMAAWKLAPALAAGNCIVIKPAEQTPVSILVMMELIADILPAGVVNVVNGFGVEAGKPLAQSPRIAKVAFTGETSTGKLIMQYASENIIPVTLELGGKSPNIFFGDIADDEVLFDKAMEGFAMFALSQGQACTCPSRAFVDAKIYDKFMEKAVKRVKAIVQGNPLELTTQMGAQASQEQLDKIVSYFDIGRKEGANVLLGGTRIQLGGDLADGYYVSPTIFEGNNKMRVFQEEIFGPVVSVTPFKSADEVLAMANDSIYGLASAVWTRNVHTAHHVARSLQAGRVWVNAYHLYPAHAAFGGYKQSGIGRETHKMMLEHYQQTKNVIMSFKREALGYF